MAPSSSPSLSQDAQHCDVSNIAHSTQSCAGASQACSGVLCESVVQRSPQACSELQLDTVARWQAVQGPLGKASSALQYSIVQMVDSIPC